MKDSQHVQDEIKKEDTNKNRTDNKNLLLGFLNLNIAGLTLVVSASMGRMNDRLDEIRESIDFQNFLMLQLMMGAEEMELPDDTISYQDAQNLYVQNVQQKNSRLLKSVAYSK